MRRFILVAVLGLLFLLLTPQTGEARFSAAQLLGTATDVEKGLDYDADKWLAATRAGLMSYEIAGMASLRESVELMMAIVEDADGPGEEEKIPFLRIAIVEWQFLLKLHGMQEDEDSEALELAKKVRSFLLDNVSGFAAREAKFASIAGMTILVITSQKVEEAAAGR